MLFHPRWSDDLIMCPYLVTSVAIVRIGIYTSVMVIRTGIVYCTRNGSWTVVRGRIATSCCRRGRLQPYGWWPVAVAGGVSQFVLRVFLNREDVFCLGDKVIRV